MEGGEQMRTLEVDERLRLIDVSSEDDCLIFSVNGNENELDDFRMSDFGNAQEREYVGATSTEREHGPVLSESLEPERNKKISKFNLRKSLTWDSAFFDSAGVLDAEELSMINCGVRKAEIHPLPGIQEDVRRSIESNSTLDSDSFSLESLEVDLFADIRASIQRSSKTANFAGSKTRQESGLQNNHSSRKTDIVSQDKMKPMPASKRQSINTQVPEKTTKEASARPRAVQATSKSGESSSFSLRPPKISSQGNAISVASTKRTSLAPNHAKIEPNTAKPATGQGGPKVVSRKAGVGDSGVSPRSRSPKSSSNSLSVTPKSLSPKSSSNSHSITNIESAASCSPHNRPGSSSSDSKGKSPLKLKNKTNSRDVNQAARSTVKTPPMFASRNNAESINSRLMTYLKSTMKTTSSISPASSVDGWSSESSSSTSTVNHHSTSSKASLDSPRKAFSLERDAIQVSALQNLQHVQPCVGYERTRSSIQFTKRISEAGALSHPPSTNASRSSKPSGLRMPSPKIGFFDAEKSMVHAPESDLQFHPGARSGIPKHGTGTTGGTVKAKPGRHQPARGVTGTGGGNSDQRSVRVPHSAPSVKPTTLAQVRELSNATPKVSATSRTREKSPGISPKNHAPLNSKGSRPKVGEREMTKTDKDSSLSLLNEVEKGCQKDLKNSVVNESRDMVHVKSSCSTPTKEDISQNSTLPSFGCGNGNGNVNLSKEPGFVSGGPINGENDFDSHLSSICKSSEKGNESQVGCLSRQMGMIDLNKEEELSCKHSSSVSRDDESLGSGRVDHIMELTKVDRGSLVCFSNEVEHGDQGALMSGIITESNDLALIKSLKSTPAREDASQNSNKASSCYENDKINPSQRSGEMPINGENDIDCRINPLCKSDEKENSLSIENQVECLRRHMGSIDLKKDGLSGKNSCSSLSRCDIDKPNNPGDPKLAFLDSKKAFVYGQKDLPKDNLKCCTLTPSSNSVETVPSPRSPLPAKLSSSNCTGSSGAHSDVS